MTTENNSPRDLNTLVNLGTYQDMTDEEIELVINYKVDLEVRRRISSAKSELSPIEMEARIAQHAAACQASEEALNYLIARSRARHGEAVQ